MMVTLDLTLVSGRTWRQGATMEGPGKESLEYEQEISFCLLDDEDMKKLSLNDGDTLEVQCDSINLTLYAKRSHHSPHQGIAFIPMGIYANILITADTSGIGMPTFKGVPVKITPAPGETVLSIKDLINKYLGSKNA